MPDSKLTWTRVVAPQFNGCAQVTKNTSHSPMRSSGSARAIVGGVMAAILITGGVFSAKLIGSGQGEGGGGGGSSSVARPSKPSILLILTDDQRWDTLWAMPTVHRELVARGVSFANAFVDDPLCCPSRASILTGRYPQSTGVWQNAGPHGGFRAFQDDSSTVAVWLRRAGYRTGLFGKYLNRYAGPYVPPGWDRWVAFSGPTRYTNYRLNVDGHLKRRARGAANYSTDVLAAQAISFIRSSRGPVFAYFAPFAPHPPATPARQDARAFSDLPAWRPPAYDERDMSDKPRWARGLPRLTPKRRARIEQLRRGTYASLLSVDRAVGGLVSALRATGRLRDSLIVFTSDNGFSWGEHRWTSKVVPYEESIRVPFVVRYDRLGLKPRTDGRLVANIDLAPTFAAAARTRAPGAVGRNLMPLLSGKNARWRAELLIEQMALLGVPTWCEVRTEEFAYVAYATGDEELYALLQDPNELTNRAGDPALASTRGRLRARARQLCRPPPPGSPLGFPP